MSAEIEKNQPVEDSAPADGSANAQAPDTAAISDPSAALALLTAERDRLGHEKAELHDRLLRKEAEFQNYRRRTERERSESFDFATMEAIRALLPVVDDFERALKVESADKEYARGMELIYQRLLDGLKKLGLEPIDSKGQPFDPNVHHAIDRSAAEGVEENTILEEFQRGYNFRGKLLREAMVRVAVKAQ